MKSIKCEWSKGLRGEGLLTWENSYRCEFHSGETTWYLHTGMIIYKRGCCTRLHVPPPPPHRQSMSRVSTPSRTDKNYARVTRSGPPTSRFFTKRSDFSSCTRHCCATCTEIKLIHAREWNPSPVQQPCWSWAIQYDSFRGMIFPDNIKRMITEPREGTGVSWRRYDSQPLRADKPIKQVLEICSLISNTLLRTLLLRILQLTVSAKDTVCSCSSLAATIASRSISDTWLMIRFEIKLNTLITKETTGLYSTVSLP